MSDEVNLKLQAAKKDEEGKRVLGFHPAEVKSDFLEPTEPEVVESFYQYDDGSD